MSTTDEDVVAKFLEENPGFLKDWILNQAERSQVEDLAHVFQSIVGSSSANVTSRLHSNSTHFQLSLTSHMDNNSNNRQSIILENSDNEESDTLSCAPSPSLVPRSGRKSVTSDLFHQWLSASSPNRSPGVAFSSNPPTILTKASPGDFSAVCGGMAKEADGASVGSSNVGSEVQADLEISIALKGLELLDPNDRLIELILDISNELDINVLCYKILLNVGYLTQADRCSLFLARGPKGKRYLEAKLFDVGQHTSLDEALKRANEEKIHIPFGEGICGIVAETKETINLKDAYKDPRFNPLIDAKTGYRTHSLVCMPLCNNYGEVIGVAQIINKRGRDDDDHEFTGKDIKVFQRYLTFCGIGLQNAQLFERSILESRKNRLLLGLARNLFQEQTSLERLVLTIIRKAKALLECERCTFYLLDLKMYDVFNNPTAFLESIGSAAGGVTTAEPSLSGNRSSMVSIQTSTSVGTGSIGGGGENDVMLSPDLGFINDEKCGISEITSSSMKLNEDNDSTGSDSQPDVGNSQQHENRESNNTISFHRVWELRDDSEDVLTFGANDKDLLKSKRVLIAKHVAKIKDGINLSNLGDNMEDPDGFVPRNMLCLPIFNGRNDVIGVAQLINKTRGTTFDENDIVLFEAFAIFCGIGIHNTKMYEGACMLMAKQKVALDCLSYHAAACDEDTEALAKAKIPDPEAYQLYSFRFIDADLSDEETFKVTIRMFMEFDLVNQFQIPYKVLCRWILSVKKNYRPVKYHNWRHALNVCQTMFTVLKTGKLDRFMTELEVLGLLVACLCHDLDHRGTNNAFESKVASPLAVLYSTSTMEHHHFDQCVMILNSEGNNIFQGLSTSQYKTVMRVVEQAILATDLALYFRRKDLFLDTANKGEIDWQEQEKKDLLCGMLMTASDVSAIAKPWEIQHKLAKRVADEFFDQGDMEKLKLNTQPIAMMDRERKDELPQMQVEFIDVVCKPLYTSLSESFPWIKPLLEGCLSNREKWADLAEKVEMGLTWIDYDTIEKPIEEITVGTGEAKDIEFTVETLKCPSNVNNNEGCSGLSGRKSQGNGIAKKRSFRATKSPLRTGYYHGAKGSSSSAGGGSFFHRRLSSKSPNRGSNFSATSEIPLDDRKSSITASTCGDHFTTASTSSPEKLRVSRRRDRTPTRHEPATTSPPARQPPPVDGDASN